MAPGEVHVWVASLTSGSSQLCRRFDLLSPGERERAARFYFDRDRHRFVVSHVLLRLLLGGYCGLEPTSLEFEVNRYGKPRLSQALNLARWTFNLAHSGDWAIYAISQYREVGVDIERLHPELDLRLCLEFLSAYEQRAISSLPSECQPSALLACWTRKEAYVKARGMGLSLGLGTFDVAVEPNQEGELLLSCDMTPSETWAIRNIRVAPEYSAALAASGDPSKMPVFQLEL